MLMNARKTSNKTTPNASIPARVFSEEFKREAVALLQSSGRSASQLSRELGVSTWSLSRWKARYGGQSVAAQAHGRSPAAAGQGDLNPVAMAEELAALRSQLHTMTRQRDILKKALGILGQESLNTIN
jgi:transposase